MPQANSKTPPTFGFLTVVKLPSAGPSGGLLIVSQIGRPIEFHCTAPLAPNRAQEIMYGETYQAYLYSDQISMALVDKAKLQPTIFITDCPDVLPVCELVDQPLILAENDQNADPFDGRGLKQFSVGGKNVFCVNAKPDELDTVQQTIGTFTQTLPLEEPFERIRQAIDEANAVRKAA